MSARKCKIVGIVEGKGVFQTIQHFDADADDEQVCVGIDFGITCLKMIHPACFVVLSDVVPEDDGFTYHPKDMARIVAATAGTMQQEVAP